MNINNMKRVNAYRDILNIKRTAFEKGIEKGEVKKAEKVAKEMLKDNEPIEKIIKHTGLTEKEIRSIHEHLNKQ